MQLNIAKGIVIVIILSSQRSSQILLKKERNIEKRKNEKTKEKMNSFVVFRSNTTKWVDIPEKARTFHPTSNSSHDLELYIDSTISTTLELSPDTIHSK